MPHQKKKENAHEAAKRLGDIHDHLEQALTLGTLEEMLYLLKVALEDRDAPPAEQLAIDHAMSEIKTSAPPPRWAPMRGELCIRGHQLRDDVCDATCSAAAARRAR